MAISNYPTIINGTYELYRVPYTGTPATDAPIAFDTIANSYYLGCTQEGFNLSWSYASKDITSLCLGETVIDGVNQGISACSISGVFMEWNHANLTTTTTRGRIEETIWKFDNGFGGLDEIGEQHLASRNIITLAAVPRTGTPAAAVNHVYYFLAAYPDAGADFNANFNLEEQIVPFQFKLYPVPHYDNLGSHSIALPGMDLTQIASFEANYTLRFFYVDDLT